ncbi:MAG: pyruvate ferredoxin oxidoreductase [Candidatus Firestonebacteria bacterium]|nr:pyruvate ferredoxin oxidoreductase [Candidatus Firestonebacteria bacterium]
MRKKVALTGNEAVAYAMKQINPDVVAAYPITPQTAMMEKFAEYVADGEVDTEFITSDSEHSAMSASIGASASGVRAMTATSSNGLAYMWEVVYIAASLRLPIVMPVVNRALSGPLNIHCDHSDTMGARDAGWIQLFSENSQEAYENTIQAIRIAEHKDVLLPVMVTLDGFIISHAMETVAPFTDDEVKNFIGTYKTKYSLLDSAKPVTFGPLDFFDYYFEHKRQQVEAIENSRKIILDIGKEFKSICGKEYGYFDEYCMEDAEYVTIALGSTAGTLKCVVDKLRKKGIKAGLLKLRCFRPFPFSEIAQSLKRFKYIAVLDRSISFGAYGGPVFNEIRSALLGVNPEHKLVNYIYGLGGREIGLDLLESVYNDLIKISKTGKTEKVINYLGVRE